MRPPVVADDPEALRAVLAAHLDEVDLVVTSGGVSAGAYDTVKEVLATTGTVVFRKVAMQPGIPQGCGTLRAGDRDIPIITLPGNPVSTYVSYEVLSPAGAAGPGRPRPARPAPGAGAGEHRLAGPCRQTAVRAGARAGRWQQLGGGPGGRAEVGAPHRRPGEQQRPGGRAQGGFGVEVQVGDTVECWLLS